MALSAPTFVQPLANDRTNVGKIVVADFTPDSSWDAGGEAIDLGQLGISEAWYVSAQLKGDLTGNYVFVWDYTNKKLLAYKSAGAAAALAEASTSDLSAGVVRVFVYGLGS